VNTRCTLLAPVEYRELTFRSGGPTTRVRIREKICVGKLPVLTLADWRASRTACVLFWAAAAFTFVMAVIPHPPQLPGEAYKAHHILAFATLAALGSFAYPRTSLIKLLIGLSLFGAFIEVAQAMPLVHRDSDVSDWVIDTAAVSVVLLIVRWWRARG
jgi:VanZ family protein